MILIQIYLDENLLEGIQINRLPIGVPEHVDKNRQGNRQDIFALFWNAEALRDLVMEILTS